MQRGTNKLKPPVSAVIDDGSYPSFVCSNVSMLVTTSRAALDNASCQPEGTARQKGPRSWPTETPSSLRQGEEVVGDVCKGLQGGVGTSVARARVRGVCVNVCVFGGEEGDRKRFVGVSVLLK